MPAAPEVPLGWVALKTRQDWKRVRARGGFIVISDDVNDAAERGPKYHSRGCRAVKLPHFTQTVRGPVRRACGPTAVTGGAQEVAARDGGARACELPDDPMYTT
jgi:hypothetical protein